MLFTLSKDKIIIEETKLVESFKSSFCSNIVKNLQVQNEGRYNEILSLIGRYQQQIIQVFLRLKT